MRVIHVLQGLHAAGIEHLALQLIAHRPAGVHCTLLNLDRSVQQLRSAFETQRASAHLEDIVDCPAADGFLLLWRCWRVFRRQQPDAVLLSVQSADVVGRLGGTTGWRQTATGACGECSAQPTGSADALAAVVALVFATWCGGVAL